MLRIHLSALSLACGFCVLGDQTARAWAPAKELHARKEDSVTGLG